MEPVKIAGYSLSEREAVVLPRRPACQRLAALCRRAHRGHPARRPLCPASRQRHRLPSRQPVHDDRVPGSCCSRPSAWPAGWWSATGRVNWRSGSPAGWRYSPNGAPGNGPARPRPTGRACSTCSVRSPRFSPARMQPSPKSVTKSSTSTRASGSAVTSQPTTNRSQFRSSWAPASPDFSGWNCVAQSGPFSTAATKSSPWFAQVTFGCWPASPESSSQVRAA